MRPHLQAAGGPWPSRASQGGCQPRRHAPFCVALGCKLCCARTYDQTANQHKQLMSGLLHKAWLCVHGLGCRQAATRQHFRPAQAVVPWPSAKHTHHAGPPCLCWRLAGRPQHRPGPAPLSPACSCGGPGRPAGRGQPAGRPAAPGAAPWRGQADPAGQGRAGACQAVQARGGGGGRAGGRVGGKVAGRQAGERCMCRTRAAWWRWGLLQGERENPAVRDALLDAKTHLPACSPPRCLLRPSPLGSIPPWRASPMKACLPACLPASPAHTCPTMPACSQLQTQHACTRAICAPQSTLPALAATLSGKLALLAPPRPGTLWLPSWLAGWHACLRLQRLLHHRQLGLSPLHQPVQGRGGRRHVQGGHRGVPLLGEAAQQALHIAICSQLALKAVHLQRQGGSGRGGAVGC